MTSLPDRGRSLPLIVADFYIYQEQATYIMNPLSCLSDDYMTGRVKLSAENKVMIHIGEANQWLMSQRAIIMSQRKKRWRDSEQRYTRN
jgi:hypothetical protein